MGSRWRSAASGSSDSLQHPGESLRSALQVDDRLGNTDQRGAGCVTPCQPSDKHLIFLMAEASQCLHFLLLRPRYRP